MSPKITPGKTTLSETEKHLATFMAHAISQPLRILGQSEGSLSTYAVFWSVAANEGRTQADVALTTGLSTKTVSRVVSRLGMGSEGMGLVRQIKDDSDRRVRHLILSHKGRLFLARMLRDLKNIKQASAGRGR